MTSLQRQLAFGLATSLLLLFGLHAWLVSTFPRALTEEYIQTRLQHDGEGLLARLRVAPDERLVIARGPLPPIYDKPYSGHYFIIKSGDAILRSRSLWSEPFSVQAAAPGVTRIERRIGPQQQPLLVRVFGVQIKGREVTIAIAEETAHVESGIKAMQRRYFVAILGTALALIAVQTWLIRRSLRPLEAARSELQRIASGSGDSIERRLPAEFQPFVTELNRLLRLLKQRLDRSRKATGNLAHALKSPLAQLAQIVEDPSSAIGQDTRREIAHTQNRLQTLIDAELRRARLAGGVALGQRFDFSEGLRDLANVLRKLYGDKTLQFELEIPPSHLFPADREDMLELLGNLLDNACKWARSRVRVSILGAGADAPLNLLIEDDGPGADPTQLARITTRGLRLDESTPGHGLGLSIVDDIVAQYGGTLSFDRSRSLGGMVCHLQLPRPAESI
ncbi:MAG: sensor histidine kinase [Thiotrichales bacterium]